MSTIESIPFEIAHYSSFDQGYQPESLARPLEGEIQNVSQSGWQTQKYPEYPQDLILRLTSGLARVSKVEILSHHYKIASQIELYAGIIKEQDPDDTVSIEFTRLGFVNLDNNARFQERELKSIRIQADCEYIRLVVKGCHGNKLNIYKQVGILALNILGYQSQHQNGDVSFVHSLSSTPIFQHDSIASYESQEIENTHVESDLEHWIKAIRMAEEYAAEDEDFKEAKLYKELGDRLKGSWQYLNNLEYDKKQAVAIKDYDEADKIKADMMQVRQRAESLLEQYGIQITPEGDILPLDTIDYNEGLEEDEIAAALATNTPPPLDEEEAIANWTSFDALSVNSSTDLSSHMSARIPITKEEPSPAEHMIQIDPETIPEPMAEDDIESCQLAICQFGENLVAHIMSVKVKCRQNGLNQLDQLIASQTILDQAANKPNKKFIHAAILMIQEAIKDSRESIFNQAIQTWKHVQESIEKTVNKDDLQLHAWMEKFFSTVLMRTSDNSSGIKLNATKTILDLIEGDSRLVVLCLGERMIRNMKDAKSRLDLVSIITKRVLIPHQWNVDPSTYRKNIMTFIVSYLNKHQHADVRASAWELLVLVAQDQQQQSAADFKNMCLFLDSDTIKLLAQELQKLNNRKKMAGSTSTSMQKALATKSNNGKKTGAKGEKRSNGGTKTSKKTKSKQQQQAIVEEDEKTNVCIFCDEANADFNEDTLISHYYNQCPVLTNCSMCHIILEVSTLKDHVSGDDCEEKHLMKQCTQCQQLIPVEQWKKHTLKKTCRLATESHSACPFCQLDMASSSESQWKSHLINKCSKNPRKKSVK